MSAALAEVGNMVVALYSIDSEPRYHLHYEDGRSSLCAWRWNTVLRLIPQRRQRGESPIVRVTVAKPHGW